MTDIASLIPQRSPIMMVDDYVIEDELNCRSELAVEADNMFLDEAGRLSVEGERHSIMNAALFAYLIFFISTPD